MGQYTEVSMYVSQADQDAQPDLTLEKALDEFSDSLIELGFIGPDRGFNHSDGSLYFTSTSFNAFNDVVDATIRFIRGHDDLRVETYFDYDWDEYDCLITVTKDGVFLQYKEKVITYSEPKKIRGINGDD